MFTADSDLHYTNVNIICKDILLYIFCEMFLKSKFNKKRITECLDQAIYLPDLILSYFVFIDASFLKI